jgi:L-asparaginase
VILISHRWGHNGVPLGHVAVGRSRVLNHPTDRITGSVLGHTYDFPGSEADLLQQGLIMAGFLDLLKAGILLRQLLVAGHDQTAVRAMFARAGGYAQPDQDGRTSGARAVAGA